VAGTMTDIANAITNLGWLILAGCACIALGLLGRKR